MNTHTIENHSEYNKIHIIIKEYAKIDNKHKIKWK